MTAKIERNKFEHSFRYYCDNCGYEFQYGDWMYKVIRPNLVVCICEACNKMMNNGHYDSATIRKE